MPLTALDIQQQSFGTSRHGYDPQEVDVFLERVATEVENYNRALLDAKARIDAAESRAQASEQQAAQAAQAAQLANAERYAQNARESAESAATEQQIAKAFIAAQKSADEMREETRRESEKAYREAESRARDIVRDALAEKQRILDEVDRLRESTEKFRTEYLSLLNHFSADAQKNLPSLEKITPDVSAEKKATADANKVLRDNDATFAAPEAAAKPVATSAPAAANAASATGAPSVASPAFAGAASASPTTSARAAQPVQSAQPATATATEQGDDLYDDLDIEEID
jgi:cell division initiation protein